MPNGTEIAGSTEKQLESEIQVLASRDGLRVVLMWHPIVPGHRYEPSFQLADRQGLCYDASDTEYKRILRLALADWGETLRRVRT